MNAFSPRTFSTDWEIMVIDRLERCADTEKLLAFAGALRSEFDLPIQVDWNTLELALGINSQFDQFVQRVRSVTDRGSARERARSGVVSRRLSSGRTDVQLVTHTHRDPS